MRQNLILTPTTPSDLIGQWNLLFQRFSNIFTAIDKMMPQFTADRLHGEIETLALISEAPPPVVTRILFSEADLKGRGFVKTLCEKAGLGLRQDPVGNLFARWQGKKPDLPAIATGSHIDAIP